MDMVTIRHTKEVDTGWQFTVLTPAATEHTVIVNKDYYQKLVDGNTDPKELVQKSFAFLLDNEPASAILAEFDLEDIEQYFPNYPQEISARLQ